MGRTHNTDNLAPPPHRRSGSGLLTLIVLGESILAATVAVQAALASGETRLS